MKDMFTNGLLIGIVIAFVISLGCQVWDHYHRTPAAQALDNLESAIIEMQKH